MLNLRGQFSGELTVEQLFGFFIRKISNHEKMITQDVNPVKRY